MRELIRGGVGPQAGWGGVSSRSDLPLNRVLYIPFGIFAYSSNIFTSSFGGNLEIFQVCLELFFI